MIPDAPYRSSMTDIIAIVLFVSILTCLGVVVKWEYKRATREPRLNPNPPRQKEENPLSIYVPLQRARRTFEPAHR